MAQQPRKGKDHPDAKAVQEQSEERKQQTEAAMKRMESSQPTPTQEENDLAKVGIAVDKKEDDGSGRTVITTTIVANEPLGSGGHESAESRDIRRAHERTAQERVRQSRE